MLSLAAALSLLMPQVPEPGAVGLQAPEGEPLKVRLTAREPDDGASLRWSPKGAKVSLVAREGALVGSFALGPASAAVQVAFERPEDRSQLGVLRVDANLDGTLTASERFDTVASERRGKHWWSFATTLHLPVPGTPPEQPATTRPYPIALWHVFDPQEPDAAPVLRWSRRGWHSGMVEIDGAPAHLLITEMRMDGLFDEHDSWHLAREEAVTRGTGSRPLSRHQWLDGKAWKVTAIDPHGRFVTLAPFDPGVTEEQERAAEDRYAADRRAPRATEPLAFRRDVDAALAEARRGGFRVLLDFETSWCGPCKQMDRLVYTAQPVVDAATELVCIKIDGDARRDLVKQHRVKGYPTLIVLEPGGAELRRATGYRSVAQTAELLRAR